MPTFTLAIANGFPSWVDHEDVFCWARNNEGGLYRATLKSVARNKDPKTQAQLGYYWGFLVPLIVKQCNEDGQTMSGHIGPYPVQREWEDTSMHEELTKFCGMIGDNGKLLRLSECGLVDCIKFIDHAEIVAIQIGIDVDALKKKHRPKG